jgi:hypothetical protein
MHACRSAGGTAVFFAALRGPANGSGAQLSARISMPRTQRTKSAACEALQRRASYARAVSCSAKLGGVLRARTLAIAPPVDTFACPRPSHRRRALLCTPDCQCCLVAQACLRLLVLTRLRAQTTPRQKDGSSSAVMNC